MTDQNQAQTNLPPDASNFGESPARCAQVSVVVPCYRCTATIDDAVASVAAQTRRPTEVFLVDDCSGDGTAEALHRVAAKYEAGWITVIALPTNGGPSRARNIGWEHSRETYIAFLDADDCWGARKLELQMEALEADPDIALIAHLMVVRPRGTEVPAPHAPVRVEIVGRRTVLVRNPFPTASVVLRRDLPLRFDEDFWRSEDYLLWSQIAFSGYRCARIEEVLAIWNEREPGATGLSDDFAGVHRARRAMRRKLVRQGLLSRIDYVVATAIGVVTKTRRNLVLRLRHQGPYRRPQA